MRPLSYVLEELAMRPVDTEGAKVAVVVYHPQSMDEPMAKVMELPEAQLATNSNRSLMEKVTDSIEHTLLDLLSGWRGA